MGQVLSIDLVSAFIRERGWRAHPSEGTIFVSSGLAHLASVHIEETKMVCFAPGGNRPEWHFDLHDPNSLQSLAGALTYLDHRCVYTLRTSI